jgi:hypothetical protein
VKVRAFIVLAMCFFAAGALAGQAPKRHFESRFVQKRTLAGFDKPIVSHGVLRFSAGGGFLWKVTSPYHYLFEMRDGQAREVLPDGTTRELSADQTPWLEAVEHIFVGALSGDRAELKRYFKVKSEPVKAGRRVTLTPKPGPMEKTIERITVIASEPGVPERLEIREKSGARMTIRFKNKTSDNRS